MRPDQGGCIPAIAVTWHSHPTDVEHSLASGFDVHLSKPIALSELLATIERLAGRENRERAVAAYSPFIGNSAKE